MGTRIRELRESHGLLQKDMAKKYNVSCNTWCQYEKDRRLPGFETIDGICREFKVSWDYLLGVHNLLYDPNDLRFQMLMQEFNNCSEKQKEEIIEYINKLKKGVN